MARSLGRASTLAIVLLIGGLLGGACSSDPTPPNGACMVDPNPDLHCGAAGVDGGPETDTLDLVGYTCSGTARPDDSPKYHEGVPEGLLCADRGAVGDKKGFCCSKNTTACAYNPVAFCDPGSYGFQCRGANRPEALNAKLVCGNGAPQGDYLNYCCADKKVNPPPCKQVDTVGCSASLLGFICSDKNLPRGEYLGSSKSRADFYYLLCPTPTLSRDNTNWNYCCYMPALVPEGGSCVQNTTVPGCAPGRFGFSCYGPETPEDDYLPMHCDKPGVRGSSAEGYPATNYCCDFKSAADARTAP